MDRLSSSSSSSQARFRESINENIEDPVSTDLMTRAVTIVPCGHTFNEDTVTQCLARDRLCPLDRREIERYVPNFTIRQLAENFGSLPAEEEGPSPEAEAHFIQGKKHADAGNNEQAVEAFLEALKLCPRYEKAQAYLEFCLKISTQPLKDISSPLPFLQSKKKEEAIESMPSAREDYINLLFVYLENAEVQKSSQLVQLFETQIENLMNEESTPLSEQEKQSYKWAKKLIVDSKVSSFAQRKLLQLSSPSASPHLPSSPVVLSSVSSSSSSSQSSSSQQGFSPSLSAASLSLGLRAMSLSTPLESQPQLPQIAFGKAKWEKYFGEVGGEPPLPVDILEILASPCPYWDRKRIEETHLLVLIPQSVNGRSLSLNVLQELVQHPQNGGHATKYSYYYHVAQREVGGQSVPASYWALITKDVLLNSRNKTYSEQQAIVKHPYAIPRAIEIATGILMHYVETGERLYSDSPCTYTRCHETLSNSNRVVVGSFGSSGLDVYYGLDGIRNDGLGLGVVRKF